jgi:hypothetical protein
VGDILKDAMTEKADFLCPEFPVTDLDGDRSSVIDHQRDGKSGFFLVMDRKPPMPAIQD